MRPRLIAALLVWLLVSPAIVPAGDVPVMRAENLGETTPFTQPQLLAVANLDQRIAATTDAVSTARLTHEREALLEQLTRTILSRGGNGLAPSVTAAELERLRDAVSRARDGGDKTAEMTAILRLNSAILSQSFTDLLTTVARDWIRFAPGADFNDAFNRFEHRTVFNQAPFERVVQRLQAAAPTTLSSAEQSLIDAYRDYSQRAGVYGAVAQSLLGFVKDAARSNQLLDWVGISALIGAIDSQPWAIDINASVMPGSQYSMGQLISVGQVFAAAALFLALTGVGLILLPVLLRLLRRAFPKQARSAQADPSESERFVRYGSDMAQVRKTVDDIRAMLIAHEGIADATTDISGYTQRQLAKISDTMEGQGIKRTLLVYLDALGDSSINILIYCFSKTVDWEGWLQVKQDVIFRCCAIVEANGLSIAFPSQTLYLRQDGGQADDAVGSNPCASNPLGSIH